MSWPQNPFWDYSLELYGQRAVEEACLELQRRHGLDVNMLLLACWLAGRGIELDRVSVARATRAVESWHTEVVRPLRALRRRLKVKLADPEPGSVVEAWPELVDGLREQALALELDGEHLVQLVLARIVRCLPVRAAAGPRLAGSNLRSCWPFESEDRRALETLIGAAFPEASPAELQTSLSWIES